MRDLWEGMDDPLHPFVADPVGAPHVDLSEDVSHVVE